MKTSHFLGGTSVLDHFSFNALVTLFFANLDSFKYNLRNKIVFILFSCLLMIRISEKKKLSFPQVSNNLYGPVKHQRADLEKC